MSLPGRHPSHHVRMASVFLTSSLDLPPKSLKRAQELAALDEVGVHAVTDDPDAADLVLFAESAWGNEQLWSARRHPIVRRHREKCFVQCELDGVVPYLPGVYTSVPRRCHREDRIRSGSYLWMYSNPAIGYKPGGPRPRWLFSFVGDVETHPVRQRILDLRHPQAFVKDAGGYRSVPKRSPGAIGAYQTGYSDVVQSSAFVLCPRGVSPSSVRVFEVMRSGRAPVVVSDAWVPPVGPDWTDFAVFVPESEVDTIPERLEAIQQDAAAMGARARQEWEEWFADNVVFHHMVESCLDIARVRTQPERLLRWTALLAFSEGRYLVDLVRQTRDHVRKRLQ